MTADNPTPNRGKATCKTCGATGPPWKHRPSIFDPNGVGNPGHKMPNTAEPTPNKEDDKHE